MWRRALCLLLLTCCEPDNVHLDECQRPCYTGPEGTQGVGECRAGRPVCDIDGKLTHCLGQTVPGTELCTGRDEDCDGLVDVGVQDESLNAVCGSSDGQCQTGVNLCVRGQIRCVGGRGPEPETCNGQDSDCNGEVDDLPLGDFCYTGPTETLAHGPCHAGILACLDGAMVCAYQVLPDGEICNGIDDDCDGQTDEGLELEAGDIMDVVFLIDRSGSMHVHLEAIRNLLELVSLAYGQDLRYRFALVDIPSGYGNIADIYSDFVEPASLKFLTAGLIADQGGAEPTWDGPFEVATGEISLSWRYGSARVQVLLTDENGQSYRTLRLHETDVAEELKRAGHRFFGFTMPAYTSHFDDIAMATGGRMFRLSGDASRMYFEFEPVLQTCGT